MQVKPRIVVPALRALLESLIDYAGIFPPAAISLEQAVTNYSNYQNGDFSWMLRWFVVGKGQVNAVQPALSGSLSVIAETDEAAAASIESKSIVKSSRPVYCEVSINNLSELDAIKQSGCFAKIRTGGLNPEAIPSPREVSEFILACSKRQLAFKATAGLHHAIRAEQALSYEANAPRAVMHGFLNILMASVFAWCGEQEIEPIISETDTSAFQFDDSAHWRKKSVSLAEIHAARKNFMHAIGSCSFDEPVEELTALGLI